jgi:hypothetical protein
MPLTYRDRQTTGTQLDVLSGELRIGSISKGSLSLSASRETPWSWGFAVHVAPPGFVMHGFTATLEQAKADMERNWQLWLTVAGLNSSN